MAATPEVRAKNHIKKEMAKVLADRNLPHKIYWNAGTGIGLPRLDCDGVIAGHPFTIEVKPFNGKGILRTRQKLTLREFAEAGAFSMVVDSDTSLELFLIWIRNLVPRSEPEAP